MSANSKMMDLSRTEAGFTAVLDKLFAVPDLPEEVTAQKEHGYSGVLANIAMRYFGVGAWNEGCQALAKAVSYKPQFFDIPQNFLAQVYFHAFDHRTIDPLAFINGVFDHLPTEAAGLISYRGEAVCRVSICLALRMTAKGQDSEAQQLFSKAVDEFPQIVNMQDSFAEWTADLATRLVISDPIDFVNQVYRNLPPNAQTLKSTQSLVIATVSGSGAFQDYFAGNYRRVIAQVFRAIRYSPVNLKNRGLISIVLKSFKKSFIPDTQSLISRA
jgi:tetratricopeptide (TPR) repeat protein